MTTYILHDMSDDTLANLFRDVAEQQYYAIQMGENRKYTKFYRDMDAIARELRRRDADGRRLLARFFRDSNPQVRLMCAAAALTVLPEQARATLQELHDSKEFPQAADAGMFVDSFDEGRWPGLPLDDVS